MTNKTELDYNADTFHNEITPTNDSTLEVVELKSDLENTAKESSPKSSKGKFPEFEAALKQNLDCSEPARIYFGNLKKIVDVYNS